MNPERKQGIIHTEIRPAAARILVIVFLGVVFGVPWLTRGWGTPLRLFPRVPTAVALRTYEEELETASRSRTWVQPRLQTLASRWGGFGNVKTVIGRDGWLFYRPDIELLTTASSASDPRPAIREFHRQLKDRGIRLILLPAPVKPMVHPDKLGGTGAPLYRSSWPQLRRELEADGILVFDPAPALVASGTSYLKTDTHWRPEALEVAVQALAQFIRAKIPDLPVVDSPDYDEQSIRVTHTGDLAAMLGVSYPAETVTIRQVQRADRLWQSDDGADVLLLGDSFANIYSAREMKWGEAAGLAERLSFHLKRPLDVIIRNDAGAHATRLMLATDLAQGNDRLVGKKIVIWEFAARELAVGDWKVFHGSTP